jgi:hypothetical protein
MQFLLGLFVGTVLGVTFKDQILKLSKLVVERVKSYKGK